jgi:hypothetical protein
VHLCDDGKCMSILGVLEINYMNFTYEDKFKN